MAGGDLLLVEPRQWPSEGSDGGFSRSDEAHEGIGRKRRRSVSTAALLAVGSTVSGLVWTLVPVIYGLSGWSLIGCVLAAVSSFAVAEALQAALREHPCLSDI